MAHAGRHRADGLLAARLAAGAAVRDAAAAAGVAERTAFRRLADPAFRQKVSELRAGLVSGAAGKLAAGMGAAADALVGQLADPDPRVRHRAAVRVVELALRARAAADLEAEVGRLRGLVDGAAGGGVEREG